LYTDLDQLEQDAQAELNQYMNQARSFPFNEDMENGDENEFTPQESGINEESPYGTLEGDSADEVLGHIDTNVDSLQQYLDDRVENGNELGNSRSTSPGEYFGARSLPLGSVDRLWEQPQIDSQQHDSVRNDQYSYVSTFFLSHCTTLLYGFKCFYLLLVIIYQSR
jgi:hypothetical protein